jgi:hypothetical protein
MAIVLDGSLGITTPDLASGPVAGTTANFSGNVTLGSSVLATPSGSAPSYTCRAWVNFNGTTSPGNIRASGNVSSVTKNASGSYTVNFTTAMPDVNFSTIGVSSSDGISNNGFLLGPTTNSSASNVSVVSFSTIGSLYDPIAMNVAVFR